MSPRQLAAVALGALLVACSPGNIGGPADDGESDSLLTADESHGGLVGHKATVSASIGLNLRTGPGTDHAIILTMPHGAVVDCTSYAGGWYKVTYNGHVGWCSALYLDAVAGGGGSGGGGSSGGSSAVDKAIERAQSGIGFSYHWGGGCWQPGSSAHGACYGNCPSCSHSGTWGADCSGYVAKVWQVPGPSALTACAHPYSTYNFFYTHAHWNDVARSAARRGDAFVHHENGAGHIFLYESGDAWGWVHAYEAKGCSYGIQHDTRMVYSNYKGIRRDGF